MTPPSPTTVNPAPLLAAVVVAHAALSGWHGAAHLHVPVPLTSAQQAFVGLVILLLPLAGAALLWSRWKKLAALLVTATMFGSLLFGLLNHFLLHSPDHVTQVPVGDWQFPFVLSAALLVLSETLGTVLGAVTLWLWGRRA